VNALQQACGPTLQGAGCGPALRPAYLGPNFHEGRHAQQRAREAGLSSARAEVIGNIASQPDLFAFRETIAEQVGCSVRTVARALKQGVEEGLIRVHLCKKGEKTPTGRKLNCRWSHRWFVGRGLAAAAAVAAIAAAKLARVTRAASRAALPPRQPVPRGSKARPAPRRWTPEEIEAELAKLPPDPPELAKPPPE